VRIFVAGGTGVIGRPIVKALVEGGHEVTASTHRPEGRTVLEELGAQPVSMDGLDEDAVRRVIAEAAPEVVINQMTSLSASARDYGEWLAVTNQLRNEATKAVAQAAREAGARRVISQSGSYMTQPGPDLADESTPAYLDAPGPIGVHIRAAVAGEEAVVGTPGVEGLVLRYGFFYGEGTAIGPGGDIAKAVAAGDMPIVGEGAGRYPFIHVDDAAAATVQAVDNGSSGVYNVVDDEPVPQAEWLPYLAELLGAPAPRPMPEEDAAEQLGVQAVYYGNQLPAASNARAKSELGMRLEYPSYREGFRKVFG
jgi:2-alkyl-3-oxoalkanoate reductase